MSHLVQNGFRNKRSPILLFLSESAQEFKILWSSQSKSEIRSLEQTLMFEFIFSFFRLQCKTFRVSQVFSPTEVSNLVPFVTKRGTNTEKNFKKYCVFLLIFSFLRIWSLLMTFVTFRQKMFIYLKKESSMIRTWKQSKVCFDFLSDKWKFDIIVNDCCFS